MKPIVNHVADQLRERTLAMNLGERLPTARQLMATFGVSQLTIQKALDRLKQEGLVTSSAGRGTFVGKHLQPAAETCNILVLTRERQTDRSNEVARNLHRALLKRDWRAAALSYSDFAQATDIVRNASGFDACVLHPRLEIVPVKLLAALRSSSRAVIVEGYGVEGVDVDGVGIDWPSAVSIGLRHLIDLGHHRVGLVTIDRPVRAFKAVAARFRVLHGWAGLESSADPVMMIPPGTEAEVYGHIAARLKSRAAQPLCPTALLFYLDAYHGGNLLDVVERAIPGASVATLGFTDLAIEHVDRLTTIGHSTVAVTEGVAVAIEQRWANPHAPHASQHLEPELVVRASTVKHSARRSATRVVSRQH